MNVDEVLMRGRFSPLKNVLCYDVFNNGFNGWVSLLPNFTEYPDFDVPKTLICKDQYPPAMLSSATYRYPGTHGSMSGTFSLKLSTKPVHNPYCEPPRTGSLGHALKRMTFWRPGCRYLQIESWFSHTAEQDCMDPATRPQPGLHENSIRAFGWGFDLQENGKRTFCGMRYLNAVDGEMKQKWQYMYPTPGTDKDWAYGLEGEWCKRGIDAFWFGKRYQDGHTDGFQWLPDGDQKMCYNETDDKLNWQYVRMKIDVEKHEYCEFQCMDKIWDMRGIPMFSRDAYGRIDYMINPTIWVETGADRSVFLYLDSVLISME